MDLPREECDLYHLAAPPALSHYGQSLRLGRVALHLQHLHLRPRHLSAERHRLLRPVSGDAGV